MRIGELAHKTGVSTRLLRYYEEQGLLSPSRDVNGYRSYPDTAVATVTRIRELLAVGLPTDSIRKVLPCATTLGPGVRNCTMAVQILDERGSRLDEQINVLTQQRALLTRHHDATIARPPDDEVQTGTDAMTDFDPS